MNKLYKNKYYKQGFRWGYEFGYDFQEEKDKVPDEEKKNFESGYYDGCAKYVNETDGSYE